MSTNLGKIKYPHVHPGSTSDNSSDTARTRAIQRRTRSNGSRSVLLGQKPNKTSNSNGKSSGDSSSRTYFLKQFMGYKAN